MSISAVKSCDVAFEGKKSKNIEEENNFHIPIEFKEYYKQQIFKTKELVLKKIFWSFLLTFNNKKYTILLY